MFRDIIVSRECIVGPNGYFGSDPVKGSTSVVASFFRPKRERDEAIYVYVCEYKITYGGLMIHHEKVSDLDSVSALLCAMRRAAHHFDLPYFNKIESDKKYRDVIPYISAIPKEWWRDMRIAGSEPMWIAEEQVIFQRADGQRTEGVIAIGCPRAGAMPEYPPSCLGWLKHLNGPDDWRWAEYTSGSAFQALQLAMASMADRLRAFVDGGGRVLTPAGDADVDLAAILGPLWTQPERRPGP